MGVINEERLLQTFADMVAIDSPSFHERKMADSIKETFAGLGVELTEDNANAYYGSEAGNLYGRLEGTLPGDPILFMCHMDTVEPARGRKCVIGPDGTIHSGGDTVLGADDQTGIAELVECLHVLKENQMPHRALEFLFCFAEEAFGKGSAQFDFGKVLAKEGYTLDLDAPIGSASLWEPTIIDFDIHIVGRGAHAGFHPEEGIHSIAIAADIIEALPVGRVDERTVLNIGLISGGTIKNAVPATCDLGGELRSRDHETALALMEKVEKTAQEMAEKRGATVKVTHCIDIHGYEIDPEEPVVKRFLAAAKKAGVEPRLTGTFGGSDNSTFVYRGGRGIVLASAMYGCHTVNESTNIHDMAKCAEIVLNLMTAEV